MHITNIPGKYIIDKTKLNINAQVLGFVQRPKGGKKALQKIHT
jgi:hypothetical protein